VTKVRSWPVPSAVTISAGPAGGQSGPPWRPAINSRPISPPNHPGETAASAGGAAAAVARFDDAAIVRAVLDGDRDAFGVLVERESAAVVRACNRVLGDQAAAEDVAQEAFVIAFRSLATWRGDGPFGAWLTRIAVRLAVRQASRRKVVPWIRPGDPGSDPDEARLPAAAADEPEQQALRAERAEAARRAVVALEEPYREVVVLRFFGERSLDEIAELTGRPLGTVKTHLHRGLLRLRGHLAGEDDR
jgi:RNA polymerase sigma-70 factor, ECF subfamily